MGIAGTELGVPGLVGESMTPALDFAELETAPPAYGAT